MTTKRTPKAEQPSDPEVLGARLRQARLEHSLSLLEVEDLTKGEVKSATLSAYELGAQTVPSLRLAQLAHLYGVSVLDLLPPIGEARTPLREDPPPPVGQFVRIDLTQLDKAKGQDAKMVVGLVKWVRDQRSASAGRYFAMRGDDLSTAAASNGRDVEDVIASLQKAGVLRRPPGRPLKRKK